MHASARERADEATAALLEGRETGLLHPAVQMQAIRAQARRMPAGVSTRFEFESKARAGITSIVCEAFENRFVLSTSLDGSVSMHDMHARACGGRLTFQRSVIPQARKPRAHSSGCTSASWFPRDTGAFFSVGLDAKALVFDADRMNIAATVPLPRRAHQCSVSSCSVAHSLLAVATDHTAVRLVDPAACAEALTLKGHAKSVGTCAWLYDDEWSLATGSDDGAIRLWDIRMPGAATVLDKLSAQEPERSRLESISSRAQQTASEDAKAHDGAVHSLHPLHGGDLVSFGADGSVRKWNTRSARNSLVHFDGKPQTTTQLHVRGCVSECGTTVVRAFMVHRARARRPHWQASPVYRRTCTASAYNGLRQRSTRCHHYRGKRQVGIATRAATAK